MSKNFLNSQENENLKEIQTTEIEEIKDGLNNVLNEVA